MLVFEFKLKGKSEQLNKIDEAIRTGQFIRNACLKYWQENRGTTKNDLQKYCAVLAANPEFPWTRKLNSMARQAHADRTWFAISRFFENCKNHTPGKKGYPRFKKNSRSVEYKTTGWKHLVAYEDLKVRNLVKNHKLAKSISDVSWSSFREWLEYFAKVFGKVVVTVPPHYTSPICSCCGEIVKKSLSVRTHSCPACKTIIDRDENAAINILMRALEILENTVGHTEIYAQGQFNLCSTGAILSDKLSGKTRRGKN